MKVLVHIGSPKAGSTSIQNALRQNAESLLQQGVLAWDLTGSKGSTANALAARFEPVERAMRPRERLQFRSAQEAHDWSVRCWEQMASDVQRHGPELTVLSSEGLFGRGKVQMLIDALSPVFSDIHIVAYVRDPVDYYRSSLDQRIRNGARFADLPLTNALAPRWHLTQQRYRKKLGDDHVILRPFLRSAFVQGDLIADFAAQMGKVLGRSVTMPQQAVVQNESLCAAATVLLLATNEAFLRFSDDDDSEQVKSRLRMVDRLRKAPSLQGQPKLGPPPEPIAESIRLTHTEAIAYFNSTDAGRLHPMQAGTPGFVVPPEDTLRKALRDWLLQHADGMPLSTLLDAAIGT